MTFEKIASSPAEGKTHMARTVRPGFSGLVNAKRSLMSAAGSPIDRGPSTWSDMASLRSSAQVCDPAQGTDARHEEILAAAQHVERLDAVNASSHRLLRNGENRPFLLPPDDRITLVADPDEIAVIDPLLLQKLHRGHRLGADEQEDGAARHFIVFLGKCIRIVWPSI